MKTNRYTVLISGMLIQFCAGIIYMWSVFKEPVAQHLSWAADSAAFTSSIMLAAFVLGIIVGGRVQDKIGPRKVTAAGSVLISLGMILSSFVTAAAPSLIYLTYGVLAGFGVGCVYTCTVSTVQKWFPDKRGFATGMIVSAFGFSLVVFAPLARTMLGSLGVQGTFLIFGCTFLVICLIGSLFIVTPSAAPQAGKATGKAAAGRQFTTLQMLKTRQFYLIAGSMLFLLPAYFIINPLLMTLGVERGLSEELALLGVMITGIASASGRLLISWMSDKTGRKAAIISIGLLTVAAACVMIIAEGVLFLVCIAAIAFAFGGSSAVFAALTTDYYGTKSAGLNFGCVMVAFALSSLLSPVVSGAISSGGYTSSFILAAVTAAVSILLIAVLKPPAEKAAVPAKK